MAARIGQPVGQKLHTNIAIVRMKRAGFKFEIACFKNKVVSWRNNVEKDIDEVLQVHTVFANVSKGLVASSADLKAAFGTDNQEKCCLEILAKGELQVSKEERDAQINSTFKEIATIISDKCINPETQRPYTLTHIEQAMREAHFAVRLTQSAKQQALSLLPLLAMNMPLVRAACVLRVRVERERARVVREKILEIGVLESEETTGDEVEMEVKVDPGQLRVLDDFVREKTKGKGHVELASLRDIPQGDAPL